MAHGQFIERTRRELLLYSNIVKHVSHMVTKVSQNDLQNKNLCPAAGKSLRRHADTMLSTIKLHNHNAEPYPTKMRPVALVLLCVIHPKRLEQ